MHSRKKSFTTPIIMATTAYLLILTVVTGCKPPISTESGKRPIDDALIVMIGPAESDPKSTAIRGGAEKYISEYPSLIFKTLTLPDNLSATILAKADEALAMKPQVICLYVDDAAAVRDTIDAIIDKSVPLITMGIKPGIPGLYAQILEDRTGSAELLGKNLTKILGGKQSYLLLHQKGASQSDTHCYERFLLHAREQVGVTLLQAQNSFESTPTPVKLISDMFTLFPHAGLIITLNPAIWLEVAPAELLGSNAQLATIGAAPALWKYLRSGQAAALAGPLDGEIGEMAMQAAIGAITESSKPGAVRTATSELVTLDNLEDFAKRYAEIAGLDLQELLPSDATATPTSSPTAVPTP